MVTHTQPDTPRHNVRPSPPILSLLPGERANLQPPFGELESAPDPSPREKPLGCRHGMGRSGTYGRAPARRTASPRVCLLFAAQTDRISGFCCVFFPESRSSRAEAAPRLLPGCLVPRTSCRAALLAPRPSPPAARIPSGRGAISGTFGAPRGCVNGGARCVTAAPPRPAPRSLFPFRPRVTPPRSMQMRRRSCK